MPKIKPYGMTVKKLIETYEGLRGGPVATLELLAFHLREGNIRARAKRTWSSNEVSLRRAWTSEPNKPDKNAYAAIELSAERDVKPAVWRKSVDWQNDIGLWDVRRGRFVVTESRDPVKRNMIRGLRLHSGDAARLFDVPKNHKARDKKHDAWRAFWHEIIRLVQNGRTDLGLLDDITSDENLTKEIVGRMPERWLAAEVKERLPYQITDNAINEELVALRERFGLTKQSAKRK